jgi:hypothetical protein
MAPNTEEITANAAAIAPMTVMLEALTGLYEDRQPAVAKNIMAVAMSKPTRAAESTDPSQAIAMQTNDAIAPMYPIAIPSFIVLGVELIILTVLSYVIPYFNSC